jgi:hypothetical protein
MCRFDVLLDPVRATTVRAALDLTVADWIRRRQFDQADPVPVDVRSTEQLCAQAVTRLAEVFWMRVRSSVVHYLALRFCTPLRSMPMSWLRRSMVCWFLALRFPRRSGASVGDQGW